jgi:hypothetical protein
VERPFFYLEQHFIKGHTWPDFAALHHDLARFVADELDLRIHATTQEQPAVRFAHERPLLTALPAAPFVSTQEPTRTVSRDCLVAFGGSRYSVPWRYAVSGCGCTAPKACGSWSGMRTERRSPRTRWRQPKA